MSFLRHTAVLAALVVLFSTGGCVAKRAPDTPKAAAANPEHPYARQDLDALVRFAGALAELPSERRQAKCRRVADLAKSDSSLGMRLHLFFAQVVTPGCGRLTDVMGAANSLPGEVQDPRLRSLLLYQAELLARLAREIDQRKNLERRISKTLSQEKKAHRRLKSQEGELRALQEKLEALKAIEQSLDDPRDGQ